MTAPGDGGRGVADIPLFKSPAAAAGGAGRVILSGVRQNLQLLQDVHGSGAAAGTVPGPLNVIHKSEHLGGQGGGAYHSEKETPSCHIQILQSNTCSFFDSTIHRTSVRVKRKNRKLSKKILLFHMEKAGFLRFDDKEISHYRHCAKALRRSSTALSGVAQLVTKRYTAVSSSRA